MQLLAIYDKLAKYPLGKWLFARLVCLKAPYFASIHPAIPILKPGKCRVTVRRRRAHLNHIKSMHAIVMCNMAELAAGLALDVSLPPNLRWIPREMRVQYLKKAMTDLTATCQFNPDSLSPGDEEFTVTVVDTEGVEVFRARVTMYISERPREAHKS